MLGDHRVTARPSSDKPPPPSLVNTVVRRPLESRWTLGGSLTEGGDQTGSGVSSVAEGSTGPAVSVCGISGATPTGICSLSSISPD